MLKECCEIDSSYNSVVRFTFVTTVVGDIHGHICVLRYTVVTTVLWDK